MSIEAIHHREWTFAIAYVTIYLATVVPFPHPAPLRPAPPHPTSTRDYYLPVTTTYPCLLPTRDYCLPMTTTYP